MNLKLVVFTVGFFVVTSIGATAQTSATANPGPPQRSVYRRSTLDDRVKRFAKVLNLDEAQQTALKSVLEHEQGEARQVRLDTSISGVDRVGRLRSLQQDTVLKIRAILNEEQKKKYDPQDRQSETNTSDSYVTDWMKTPQR